MVASKRQLTEFSSHENLQSPQIPSVANSSYAKEIPQRGIINQMQVLPTIHSLPKLHFQPLYNLPRLQITLKVIPHIDNFARNQTFNTNYQNLQSEL